jgi:hypothetical protein
MDQLTRRVEGLELLPRPFVVPINTLAPYPFEISRPLLVLVEPIVDDDGEPSEYLATFTDGAISTTGDTIEEAVLLLKDRMVAQYTRLTKRPPDQRGKIPQQQLAALQAVMRKTQ